MHDGAGKGAVGAGLQQDLDVGLFHGVVVVDVDRRDLCTALLAGAHCVRHHIDLGVDGIGTPNHDQVRDSHLARVDAGDLAGADGKSDARDVGADGRVEARIFLHIGEAVDAIAHHQSHGAGVIIRPDRFSAEFALGGIEASRDFVQRLVPGNSRELARTLQPGATHRIEQTVRMVNALGVTRDLGADNARGISLLFGAPYSANAAALDHLDVERAGRRAIMRTGRMADIDLGVLVHVTIGNIKCFGR